jgi:hypothetical protein
MKRTGSFGPVDELSGRGAEECLKSSFGFLTINYR